MSSGRVPPQPFDESRYARPHKNWLCGRAGEGCPCLTGPSPDGVCRTTAECRPQLVVEPGETKGLWKCKRPAQLGGPCAAGPLPDGTCCRTLPPCKPVRSLRHRRGSLVLATVIASVGALLIGLSASVRESFVNPGPLSLHHASAEFASGSKGQGCALCHADIGASFPSLVASAAHVAAKSLTPGRIASLEPKDFSAIDRLCLKCHTGHAFHEPGVDPTPSCSVCHREHRGAGPMPTVVETNCSACHGDAKIMAAAAQRSAKAPAGAFARKETPGLHLAPAARPPEGFTKVITSFADGGHPEFAPLREKRSDENPLKFNHHLHLPDTPLTVGGQPLECVSCHRPDVSGRYFQPIAFEETCRACHTLGAEAGNAAAVLPHGNPALVRDYLRSRATVPSEPGAKPATDDAERVAFFGDGKTGLAGAERVKGAGCVLCHEVTARGTDVPAVTAPRTPDRWLSHAHFNHARHAGSACTDCHEAAKSERTADIILPTQESCTQCHSPKGGAVFSCGTCHSFHNTPNPDAPSVR